MKIETEVVIDKCLLTAKGVALTLGRFRLNMRQHQEIYRMIQDQEKVQVHLNEIASLASIKKCLTDSEGDKPTFTGLVFSSDQYKKLAKWVKDGEEVTITLEPGEPNMFAGSDDNLFDKGKNLIEAAGEDPEEMDDDFDDEPDGGSEPEPKQGKAKPGKKKRQRKVKDLIAAE
mgnify:FL=1